MTAQPTAFEPEFIASLRERLERHPIYAALRTLDDLRVFMAHHVHSVWDFMSLIKYLQHAVAPARWPWTPGRDASIQRFINELVLEEETDAAGPAHPGEFTSHFQLYLGAMREIGADAEPPARFVEIAGSQGIAAALQQMPPPLPAQAFTRTTFDFIASDKPHNVAIALAEHHPDVDPRYVRFTDLHRWVMELEAFSDDPNRSGEKILEAIQASWIEEMD